MSPDAAGAADTRYFKLSGGGNDFVAFADPGNDPEPAMVRALCRRGVSLGADGLFVLRQAGPDVKMDYWNADGRPSELCLNGTRCAAKLAWYLGWAAGGVTIVTGSGRVEARPAGPETIALELPLPAEPPDELTVTLDSGVWQGWSAVIGVPHFVLLWQESLENAPVTELGSALRHAPEFPAGTNVDFARFVSENEIELRTYERGVEAETLACGTGILATAAVGLALGIAELPLRVKTLGGFPFEVAGGAGAGQRDRWSLIGEARLLAEGTIRPAALVEVEPPKWAE